MHAEATVVCRMGGCDGSADDLPEGSPAALFWGLLKRHVQALGAPGAELVGVIVQPPLANPCL